MQSTFLSSNANLQGGEWCLYRLNRTNSNTSWVISIYLDLFSGGGEEERKGLDTLAAFPCALGMSIS